jgi:hypothetical protein
MEMARRIRSADLETRTARLKLVVRKKSPIIISIWNRDRQKRAREEPVQRPRRHAVVHEV